MWTVVHGVTAVFDGLIGLFDRWHPMVGLLVISIITGAIMLIIFRYTSNQAAIADTKNKIKAYILEVRLFKDDLPAQMAAQRRILWTNFKYIRYATAPMLVMLIPVLVILIQLDVRYARRPLLPGEDTILKVEMEKGTDISSLRFEPPAGIVSDMEPVRIPERNQVTWRLEAEASGAHDLIFTSGGEAVTKRLEVGDYLTKLADERKHSNAFGVWENPAEPPLPKGSAFRSIVIEYPDRDLRIWGFGMHWLLVFFASSVIFGFAIKGFVGVEV
ncbi:MAG: hypothetical protein ABIK65_12455 [Candidatus Eisenbacteria bacterium]